MPEQAKSNITLLLVGLSAGAIAAFFPRLIPFLTQAQGDVTIELFTTKFIIYAAVFSFMIGISMIWMYMGTKEHTKNLFMSALAIPSVLSGALNMSNMTTVAENELIKLDQQTVQLQDQLKNQYDIKIESFDLSALKPIELSSILNLIGINSAYAVGDLQTAPQNKSSINIKSDNLNYNYHLLFGNFSDINLAQEKLTTINNYNIPNVNAYEINGNYYLIQSDRKTKSDAILEAIKLNDYGLQPQILLAE